MTDVRTAVLGAMRRPRDETQLTRTIAALTGLDESVGPALVRSLLETAADGGGQRARTALQHAPSSVTLVSEGSLGQVRGRWIRKGGRLDWYFEDGESFRLVVEVKVEARSERDQLERYLATTSWDKSHGGLLLLSRRTAELPGSVTSNPRWLGQIRWDQLLPHLRAIEPTRPDVAEEWRRLIDVVRAPGDLADPPVSWQLAGRTAGRRNAHILEGVKDRVVSTLATGLAARHELLGTSDGLVTAKEGKGLRSVTSSRDVATMTLFIPAKNGAAGVEIKLAGTRAPLKLTTSVAPPRTRVPGVRIPKHDESAPRLGPTFTTAADGWLVALDKVEKDGDTEPTDAVWRQLEARLRAIVESGALDSRMPRRARRR
ncbi:hypothetical protein DSM112329_04781 [Paraconexibacter sp. AEG42_29]|uniref:PD-(D/E)XK nuclease superfamily protein n=1 Tax=Paraconexibacter sp. AEG42_29 TaxID=2997339 RepID=A0AAU7B1T7_9ACTN